MVDMAGIPSGSIAFSERARVNWHNILKEANMRGSVTDLVQLAIQDYPKREELKRLYHEVEITEPLTSATSLHLELDLATLKELPDKISSRGSGAAADELKTSVAKEIEELDTAYRSRSSKRTSREELNRFKRITHEKIIEIIRKSDMAVPQPSIAPPAPAARAKLDYDILVPGRKGLEKMVGSDDLIDIITWVEGAKTQSKTVCKIETAAGASGTGFLLPGGLLMTNNHVIPDVATAATTRLTFNYKVDQDNNVLTESRYLLDPTVFITSYEDELDYTVVKVQDNAAFPLSAWGSVQLEEFFEPNVHEKVTVIQHPKGNYMKMALPDDIISIWDKYLFYTTDTREGSSGAPVFNKHWKVVALHHAGKNEESYEGGLQINAEGAIEPANRGILIKRILADLKDKNFNLA